MRFLYLFQVHGDLPRPLDRASGPDSTVRFLSYGAPSADPRALHYPSSSWTQGRNRLWRAVSDTTADYVIFGDGDIRLERMRPADEDLPASLDPWRAFEHFLRRHRPAVGVPNYAWHLSGRADLTQPVQTIRFFDPVLTAIHREALAHLLPYCDLLEEECSDYSGSLLCSMAAALYPGLVLQTNRVKVLNPESLRGYTERLLTKAETLYLSSVRDETLRSNFRRQPEWSQLPHQTMGPVRAAPPSYALTDDALASRFDLTHPLWARQRELRALPEDDPFWSADPDTPRAQRWRACSPGRVTATGLRGHLAERTRPLRLRLGLVRSGRPGRALLRLLQVPAHTRLRRARRRWRRAAHTRDAVWRAWRADTEAPRALPDAGDLSLVDMICHALGAHTTDAWLLVEVGTGQGEVLGALADPHRHETPVISVGVDATQTRGFAWYSGYVLGTLGEPPLTLATILCQYGLAERTIHWLHIREGDATAALHGLGTALSQCLFVTVPASAAVAWPAAFRAFARARPVATCPDALTVVNLDLLNRLWPPS